MTKWPQSRARKWRKFWTALRGRRNHVAPSQSKPTPRYQLANLEERLLMWRLSDAGLSARAVGRRIHRDHHTVLRHLQAEWGEDLALSLALRGMADEAREMAWRLKESNTIGSDVEKFLATHRAWITFERDRVNRIADEVLTRRSA